MTRLVIGIGFLVAGVILQFGGGIASAATSNVSVQDNSYVLSAITINVGDSVQWTWAGSNQHTVSSNTVEVFNSGAPQSTGTFSHTFNTVGTFTYECGVHGSAMSGTVIVQQAPTATSTTLPATSTNVPPTNTPPAATNTPGVTTTAQATATPVTPTLTSVPSLATPTQPAVNPPVVVAAPTRAAGAVGAALPRTGTGRGDGGSPQVRWTAVILACLGAVLVAVSAGGAQRRTS